MHFFKRFSGDAKSPPVLLPEVVMMSPEVMMTSPGVMMTSPEVVLTGRLGSGNAISHFPGHTVCIRSVLSDGKHLLTEYYRLTSGELEEEEDFRRRINEIT